MRAAAFVVVLVALACDAAPRNYGRGCDVASRRSDRGGVACGRSTGFTTPVSYVPYFTFAPASGEGLPADVCTGAALTGTKGETITQNTAADGQSRPCMKGNWYTGIKNGDVVALTGAQPKLNYGINGTGAKGITGYDTRQRVNRYPNFETTGSYWGTSAQGHVGYVGTGAVVQVRGAGTDPSPSLPNDWLADDIFIAVLNSSGTIGGDFSFGTVTTPAGWTLLVGPTDNESANYGVITRIYYRRAVGGDTAPTFVTSGTNAYGTAIIAAYRGAIASGNPFEVVGTPNIQTASTTTTATGITTLSANARVVVVVGLNYHASLASPGTSAWTGSPAPTQRFYVATTTPGENAMVLADFLQAAAGATGNRSATILSTPSNAVMLALKSAGGATPAAPVLTRDVGMSPMGTVEAVRMVTPAASGSQFSMLYQAIPVWDPPPIKTSASYFVKGCIDGAADGGCVDIVQTSDPAAPVRADNGQPAIGLDGGIGAGVQGFCVGAWPQEYNKSWSCADTTYNAVTWTRAKMINVLESMVGPSGISIGAPSLQSGRSYSNTDVLIWQSDYQTCETLGPPIRGDATYPALTLAESYTADLTMTGNSRCMAMNAVTPEGEWADGTSLLELRTSANNTQHARIYSNKLRCSWVIGGVTSYVESAATVLNGVDQRLACLSSGTAISACVDGTCTASATALTLPTGASTLIIGGGYLLVQPTNRESNSSKNYNVIVDTTSTGCSP